MSLWGGRFSSGPSDALFALSKSVDFDWRLAIFDLASSKVHLQGLIASGIVLPADGKKIEMALEDIATGVKSGGIQPAAEDEDVHSALERLMTERIGELGGALRAGRSRNDQIVTDLKLYLLYELASISDQVADLALTIMEKAKECGDLIAPGFTHLQHAQPVTFAQELAKHSFAFSRDLTRLADWRERANQSPLGSGALAGSALVPDPEKSAHSLGFASVVGNSIDGVSDRDFVAEALFVLAMIGLHLSRIGEEFTLYASQEFGWVELDDRYSTGSSIMPQKKNPDIAELARGKSGRFLGNLMTVMTVLKGMAFSYNRDLQEDKEPIFDSIDQLHILIPAVEGMIKTCSFNRERIRAGAENGFALATELADYLVRKGKPFAKAHEIAGQVVKSCETKGVQLHELDLASLKGIDSGFDHDVLSLLRAEGAVKSRISSLGTSFASVSRANERLDGELRSLKRTNLTELSRLSKVLGL